MKALITDQLELLVSDEFTQSVEIEREQIKERMEDRQEQKNAMFLINYGDNTPIKKEYVCGTSIVIGTCYKIRIGTSTINITCSYNNIGNIKICITVKKSSSWKQDTGTFHFSNDMNILTKARCFDIGGMNIRTILEAVDTRIRNTPNA
jgi:hypothetical protein